MAARSCANRTTAICLLVVASVLFLLSVVLLAIFPNLYNTMLQKQLFLVKGTTLFPIWRKLPIPIYERLYFFNITNEEEFLKGEGKLNVTQVGPYTYKSVWLKENIRWYPNKTVSYQERRVNQFVPEMSHGSEDDTVWTLNGPMIMSANHFKDSNFVVKLGLSGFFDFEEETLITKKSVKQLAFVGYEDPIIKDGKWFMKDIPFKNGIFSWLYDKNDTYDGTFTVYTGERDFSQLNVIDKWNGYNHVNYWKNESCNMINGSSGEVSPPLKEGQSEFTFFQSLFCRSLTFPYASDEIHSGLLTKRFRADRKVFGNETVNENNACFDTKPYLPSGVQDISGCQFNAPVLISFPHFYLADSSYLQQINGLHPNSEQHSSHFDVEPRTGISIHILIRAQLNLELEPIDHIYQTSNLPHGVFPVLWFEVSAEVTEELIAFLEGQLDNPKKIFYGVVGSLLLVSGILFAIGVVVFCRARREPEQANQPLIHSDSEKVYTITNNYSSAAETVRTDVMLNSQEKKKRLVVNENEVNKDGEILLIDTD